MLNTPDTILMLLGYGATYSDSYVSRQEKLYYDKYLVNLNTLPVHIGNRVDSIIVSLTAIDAALQSAPLDGMATKVDKLEVSYTQYTNLLKKEGSRMLHEISTLVNIPVNYDRYLQKKPTAQAASLLSFVSYW